VQARARAHKLVAGHAFNQVRPENERRPVTASAAAMLPQVSEEVTVWRKKKICHVPRFSVQRRWRGEAGAEASKGAWHLCVIPWWRMFAWEYCRARVCFIARHVVLHSSPATGLRRLPL